MPQMAEEGAPLRVTAMREIILIIIALFSILTTRRGVRESNHFSWEPITEVAVVFIGIFATMTPALIYLNANAAALGLQTPAQFFYGAGFLSAFLDNSPTAVAFHTVAQGLPHAADAAMVAGVPQEILRAISLGSVFFGAMTYIGNGPNFMVKAIAEQEGVKMPSFFGYIFRFSLIIMLPVYIIVQLIFL
jgi:Na+/H+ antiporter NhaD/arsenite permease-like protein